MKRSVTVAVVCVVIALLTVVLVWGIASPPAGCFGRTGDRLRNAETVTEFSTSPKEVREIDIETSYEDVVIETGSSSQIEVEQTAYGSDIPEERMMRCAVEGGSLIIRGGDLKSGISFSCIGHWSVPSSRIIVRLPQDLAVGLLCGSASGSVSIEGCTFEDVDIDTASGDVELTNVTGKETLLSTASGSALLKGCSLQSLDVDTASGDIFADVETEGSVHLTSFSGQQEYSGSSGSINCSAASGDIRLRTQGMESIEAETMSGEVTMDLSDVAALRSISVNTASGDVDIALPRGSSVNPDLESASGEMRIDSASDFQIGKGPSSIEVSVETASGDLLLRGE